MKTLRYPRLHSLVKQSIIIGLLSLPCLFATTASAQTNIAQGKSVTGSTTNAGYPASNSVDGNQGTYWEAQMNAFPQTLTVDLGSDYNVNRVVLKLPSNWGTRTQTLSVSGSTNGSSYSTLVNSASYNFTAGTNSVTINVPSTSARYVRLNVTANTGWPAAQISEMEVYGDNQIPPRDAFAQIKATSYNSMSGIQTEATTDAGGGSNVGWIDDGDWLAFNNVNFGTGAEQVNVRVASNHAGGTIEMRLGSISGSLIGTVDVGYTGGWQNWETKTANVNVSGAHDLYLVFKGNVTGGLFNVNWLQFAGDEGDPQLPGVPQNLRSTGKTTDSISIAWDSVSDADGYEILRNGSVLTTSTSTSYTNTGLAANTTYSYTVRAFNSAGSSAQSTSISVTTDNDNDNPLVVKVSSGKPTTASTALSFTPANNAVDNNAATYWESNSNAFPQTLTVDLGSTHRVSRVILKLPNDAAWATRTQTLSVLGSGNGTSFTQLVASAGYVFNPASANTVTINFAETSARYVRINVTGNTGWPAAQISEFEVWGYPDPIPPSTPQNLRSTGVSASSVFLAWDAASGATSYRVMRGNTLAGTVSGTTYEDTGLTPVTNYNYTVIAVNQYGTSSASNQITATTSEEGDDGDGDGDWEPNGEHGAQMPYKRYDTEHATMGGGAQLKTAPTFIQTLTAAEASGQAYIALPSNGSFAQWTIRPGEGGAGVTMRFTMPDSSNGMGLTGALDVYVNGTKAQTVQLTSYYNYQYFNPGSGHPSDTPGGIPLFRFDEVHWKHSTPLQPGDVIRIVKANGDNLEYGVDFLEIEQVPAAISRPGGSVSVTDFGAIANDGNDDLAAFNSAVTAAVANNQILYIPAGTFHLSSMWVIGSVANKINNITIRGAGIWHTNIQFTNPNISGGGISFRVAGQLDFSHVYMNSMLRSRYHEGAIYKAFMDNFGKNSKVHNVWVEHFECGFWVGDYAHTPAIIADNLLIENSRIRNNLADGVNFAQGTSNSTVRNSSIRNNGDDGLAVWTSNVNGAPAGVNNLFTYNTIEHNWRAAGIAFFGGSGHKATYNLIVDGIGSSGFRMNTVFPGYHFQNNTGIEFSNSTIIRSGTSLDTWGGERGAIDLEASSDPIRNVTISNIEIYDTQRSAVQMGYSGGFQNVVFNDIKINGTGKDGVTTSRFAGPHLGAAIYSYTNNGTATFNGLTTSNIANPNINFIQPGFNLIINP